MAFISLLIGRLAGRDLVCSAFPMLLFAPMRMPLLLPNLMGAFPNSLFPVSHGCLLDGQDSDPESARLVPDRRRILLAGPD